MMMKVSFFARLTLVVLLLATFVNGAQIRCGSGREGMAVRGDKYMSKSYRVSDPMTPSFDWVFCRDWCQKKKRCRAWELKFNAEGGRCDLHRSRYKWVRYTGKSSTYAGRCRRRVVISDPGA
ncbi:hypothetical protein PSENEW3_00005729 [Picochlorum sp. SENEW3]|nr:hypothetical protein PSENEW3_00005729 [Picochlorum sp. SENEW3]